MEFPALEKAAPGDRDAIVALFHRAVDHLNETGIPQWDAIYPHADDVEEDLQNGQLYVMRIAGRIAGVITLNQVADPAYATAGWSYRGTEYRVVHRLCISPDAQGQGIGTGIMRAAEAMLRQQGVKSVRLDAFSKNPVSLRLYEKLGYRTVGEAMFRKGLFYLMEKRIGG